MRFVFELVSRDCPPQLPLLMRLKFNWNMHMVKWTAENGGNAADGTSLVSGLKNPRLQNDLQHDAKY